MWCDVLSLGECFPDVSERKYFLDIQEESLFSGFLILKKEAIRSFETLLATYSFQVLASENRSVTTLWPYFILKACGCRFKLPAIITPTWHTALSVGDVTCKRKSEKTEDTKRL